MLIMVKGANFALILRLGQHWYLHTVNYNPKAVIHVVGPEVKG